MTTQHGSQAQPGKQSRQFVRYVCYKVQPEWRRLPKAQRDSSRAEFAAVVDEMSDGMMVRSYSLAGTRGDADLMLWEVAPRLDNIQNLAVSLSSTELGRYMDTPHSYLAMTRRSIYVEKHEHPGQEGARIKVRPAGAKYLFVYPFVKTREWYLLPKEERQQIMDVHIGVGHKYPGVRINTSYSFGLDDQDFVVAFEGDDPGEFLDLVMDLRETQSSKYTVRDTPIFTGVSMTIQEALASLGD